MLKQCRRREKIKRVERENSTTFPTLSLIQIQYVFLYSSESKPDWSMLERISRAFFVLIFEQLEKLLSVCMIWAYSTSFWPVKIAGSSQMSGDKFKIINEEEKIHLVCLWVSPIYSKLHHTFDWQLRVQLYKFNFSFNYILYSKCARAASETVFTHIDSRQLCATVWVWVYRMWCIYVCFGMCLCLHLHLFDTHLTDYWNHLQKKNSDRKKRTSDKRTHRIHLSQVTLRIISEMRNVWSFRFSNM